MKNIFHNSNHNLLIFAIGCTYYRTQKYDILVIISAARFCSYITRDELPAYLLHIQKIHNSDFCPQTGYPV
jgi:hypothetical protein